MLAMKHVLLWLKFTTPSPTSRLCCARPPRKNCSPRVREVHSASSHRDQEPGRGTPTEADPLYYFVGAEVLKGR